ncbi:hypothetical protein DUNSADRAFT_18730 [Dunaliella salina]|uniref:Encoded protein n=1 Tax=Dunaliella salina TaxID=3046 RepID=A0ABQ7GYR3_DUNSA|nr:hypothetical protein DUNSADRAFT_18730 [Dunaliella salina]|eukprot:KAF5839730.1 hypothetical protein DUNSADRAFT_18730 [Dunaliella salina]
MVWLCYCFCSRHIPFWHFRVSQFCKMPPLLETCVQFDLHVSDLILMSCHILHSSAPFFIRRVQGFLEDDRRINCFISLEPAFFCTLLKAE